MTKLPKFKRLELIIGQDNLKDLSNKTVLVLGCGGVGGYTIESLVRSNIGKLIIVDCDVVDESNINRQIIALNSTIGKYKVDVFKKRIKDINSNCKVKTIKEFITKDNIDILFKEHIDYFVDACDTLETKKEVIKECINRNIKLISSMGTGNKLDPSKLKITTLDKTEYDPIAKILRKYCRDNKINKKITVLCSTERPIKTNSRVVGSTSFVPSSAGLLITSYIIKDIIK